MWNRSIMKNWTLREPNFLTLGFISYVFGVLYVYNLRKTVKFT